MRGSTRGSGTALCMPLDRDLRPLVDDADASAGDSYRALGPDRARQVVAEQLRGFEQRAEAAREVARADATIPSASVATPVRIYTPSSPPPRPGILFMHGGGWTYGSISTHDGIVARLAAQTGATVVSVGYRLSPEAPFPCALDDTVAAVRWMVDRCSELGVDVDQLAVAGDSAGANLAAASALSLRGDGPRLAAQLLFYPQLD